MFTIKGKATEAICYADAIDQRAEEDIQALCDHPLLADRRIRIMPDAHANGDGTVTGFTMLSREPVILGLEYGSGCGVCCARLNLETEDSPEDPLPAELLQRLDEVCHEIPARRGEDLFEPAYEFDFSVLRCYEAIRQKYEWPTQLGALGGGNHFMELDRDEEGACYLVIHNGLGGLSGPAVRYYRDRALERAGKSWREAGLEDTCLYGGEREDFLHDMRVFEEVCRVNRRYLADYVTERTGLQIVDFFDICHHYTDPEDQIVRHGAIAAREGQRVIIPVNAREGCIIGTGKGNPQWNCSAPHGGGRVYSRRAAKQELTMDQYREAMKGVYTTTVSQDNLDEAPAAYRSMETIIRGVRDSVEVEGILRPLYSYKG